MSKRVLLQGDVDAIQSYVFEASGLPQIRGGSQRLIKCEQEVEKLVEQRGGRTIYCSGGGFLFEVFADEAENLKREIERLYLKYTQVATVTVVYEDAPEPPPPAPNITDGWAGRLVKAHQEAQNAGKFARRTAFLAARLREAKQKKRTAPFIEAFPFGERCEICGKRVAEKEITYTVAGTRETKRICHVCFQRHETGRKYRHRGFEEYLKERQTYLTSVPPQDLNELAESARRPYVAFLYADGNNIGDLLHKVKDKKEYAAFSRALAQGTERALYEALWETCQKALEQDKVWPFEILNIGGDDVTLLIQAGYAWEVAMTFLKKFEEYVKWKDESITASVGITITDAKHPVRYLEALATDLLKRAKKKSREAQTSAIDFIWLPNAIAVTKAEMVSDLYRRNGLTLTSRPYTLAQAQKLQDVVDVLARWPRSLRHRWGEGLERGRLVSLSLILYDLARRVDSHQKAVNKLLDDFKKLKQAIEQADDLLPATFWWESRERDEVVWRTALLDALELAELRAMRSDVQEEEEVA